jgi:hypothetical protein
MTGPRPAGRPWTQAEVAQLHELIAKAEAFSRRDLLSHKFIQENGERPDVRCETLSLPSERIAFAHANAQSSRLVELNAQGEKSR